MLANSVLTRLALAKRVQAAEVPAVRKPVAQVARVRVVPQQAAAPCREAEHPTALARRTEAVQLIEPAHPVDRAPQNQRAVQRREAAHPKSRV